MGGGDVGDAVGAVVEVGPGLVGDGCRPGVFVGPALDVGVWPGCGVAVCVALLPTGVFPGLPVFVDGAVPLDLDTSGCVAVGFTPVAAEDELKRSMTSSAPTPLIANA